MYRRELKIVVVNNIGTLRRFTVDVLKQLEFQKISTLSDISEIGDFEIPRRDCLYIIEFDSSGIFQDELDYLSGLASITTFSNNKIIFTSQNFDVDTLVQLKVIKSKELIRKTYDLQTFSENLNYAIEKLFPNLKSESDSISSLSSSRTPNRLR